MKLKKSIAAALLLTASVAFAYEDVTDLSGATEAPKGEGDGNVSEYEARNNNELVESFSEVDADNDGVLSENELSDWKRN